MHGLKFRGRPPIHLAETVKDVVCLTHSCAAAILNRQTPLDSELVKTIIGQSIFTWEGRSPSSALDVDGNFVGTDLDLLSFLVPMAERGAVIEIPKYNSRSQKIVRETERRIGGSRFGKITGLISNQTFHSFSVRLFDQAVVVRDPLTEEERTGDHRNYMLVDYGSEWYPEWNKIVWNPTSAENSFLTEKRLWMGNTVNFKNYVHPNRWQSVFGAPYLLLKMLIARLNDEAGFYREEMNQLEKKGIALPLGEIKPYVPPIYKGETDKETFEVLEMVLDLPSFSGVYSPVPDTQAGLLQAYRRQKFLTWTLKPMAQFVVRADETAYYRYGENRIASWIGRQQWNHNWKPPRGRVSWNQMTLSSDVSLRYRIKEASTQVNSE